MGLFGLFGSKKQQSKPQTQRPQPQSSSNIKKEVEKEMYEKNLYGYRDMQDSLEYQNKLLNKVNAAQEKYKKDKDLDAVIKALEFAFIESDPPCKTSQNMDLADYYIKAGQNDNAWSYLNRLYVRKEALIKDIRFAQARLLKKEKKYADAIEMYMLGYLDKCLWNKTFQKEMFLKDIRSSVNQLGWNEEITEKLCQILEKQVKDNNNDEALLVNKYRELYSSITNHNI